jgi:phosphoribosyl-AMP cyclohydrolase
MTTVPAPAPDDAVAALVDSLTFTPEGLIPAIAQQHDSGEVLMMAWMDAQSLRLTLETGWATYWSRSRGQLWRKGATSGHLQRVVSVAADCDRDTLLLQVDQTGPACHTETVSCFTGRVVAQPQDPRTAGAAENRGETA